MKVSAARLSVAVVTALNMLLGPAAATATAPAGRYTFPSAGVVHDSKTGLNWQQATAPGTYTWAGASMYCSMTLGGTWRLPAIKELQTLLDGSVPASGPTIDGSAFPSTPASPFWSSTPFAASASSDAWVVNFLDAANGTGNMSLSMFSVRCVR